MEALATSKHVRISPRKARLVANLIRGKSVDEALGILALTPKKASPIIQKVMLSAAANVKFKNDGAKASLTIRSSSRRFGLMKGPR